MDNTSLDFNFQFLFQFDESLIILLHNFNSISLFYYAESVGTKIRRRSKKASYDYFRLVTNSFIAYSVIWNFLSNVNIKIFDLNEYSCKLLVYIAYFLSPISSWLLVFLSLNRLLAIKFHKIKIINKPIFQTGIIIAIIIYNLFFIHKYYF